MSDDWRHQIFNDNAIHEPPIEEKRILRRRLWCKDCDTETLAYASYQNWDFWWRVVDRLRSRKHVTKLRFWFLVRAEKKTSGYQEGIPLPERFKRKYEQTTNEGMISYLQKIAYLGPEKRHLLFFKKYRVLAAIDAERDDFVPRTKVRFDGSCVECGGHNLISEGDDCPLCKNGTLCVYEECEPAEFRELEEFEVAGEKLNKKLYCGVFSRYVQGQLATEEEVLDAAKQFDGDVGKAVNAIENSYGRAFESFIDEFFIGDESFKKDAYPCVSISYSDDKIEAVERIQELAKSDFAGNTQLAVEAEEKRLSKNGPCVRKRAEQRRMPIRKCGTC
jgi:hypothetical protein